MAKEESPAFQFYPKDYLSDVKTRAMSYKERGMYWELCAHIWLEKVLPADPAQLARILGMPPHEFKKHWPALEPCFRVVNGGYEHPRLEVERRKQQDRREEARIHGQKGAAKLWAGRRQTDRVAIATPSNGDGDPSARPIGSDGSSSSSSTPVPTPPKNGGVGRAPAPTLIARRNGRRMNEAGVVPLIDTQFAEFVSRVSPKHPNRDAAYDAVTAWMLRVDAEIHAAGKTISADPFKWWDARFKTDWPDESADLSTEAIVAAMDARRKP